MSKSHQHEAQNVHSASVCSKVKIDISFYLSQACQRESTSKEQEQNKKLNVIRSEEHMSELQSPTNLVCRLLLEKKKNKKSTVRRGNERIWNGENKGWRVPE